MTYLATHDMGTDQSFHFDLNIPSSQSLRLYWSTINGARLIVLEAHKLDGRHVPSCSVSIHTVTLTKGPVRHQGRDLRRAIC